MEHAFSRTEMLLGQEALQRLAASHVIIFGVGGVGSFVVEALARSGVGRFTLIDKDVLSISNINRQLPATTHTIGQAKVAVMKERVLAINPNATVVAQQQFYLPGSADDILGADFDYIVDAVDNVSAKIDLAVEAGIRNIPIISSMGAGNKLDPTAFRVADIFSTTVCPLARVMRRELRRRAVTALKVVYSTEQPLTPQPDRAANGLERQPPGSVAFVPPVVGMIVAGEVIKDLINFQQK